MSSPRAVHATMSHAVVARYHAEMSNESPAPRILPRRETAGRLLDRRPDLSVERTQRRRARDLAASLGNQAGVVDVLAAWLEANPDSDMRDLSSALGDRLQLRLASLAPAARTEELTVTARVEEAFGLGWEQLDDDVVRELLHLLTICGESGAPADVLCDAAGARRQQLESAVERGFAVRDDDGLVRGDPATLTFVTSRGETPTSRHERRLRLAQAVRNHAARTLPTDITIDAVAERAHVLLGRLAQYGLQASLAHRMTELLRLRGDLPGARMWVQRGLEILHHHAAAAPLAGLLALDEASLVLFEQGANVARSHAQRATELLAAAVAQGEPGAEHALARARLMVAQIEAGTRSSAPEAELLNLIDTLAEQAARPGASRDARAALAVARQTLGSALLRRGQRTEARELLAMARTGMEGVTVGHEGRVTGLLVGEAQAMHLELDPAPMARLLERARVLGGGDMDREPDRALPLALHELGLAAGERGDRDSAATFLDEAAMLSTSLLPDSDPVRATTAYSRGLLFLADGQYRGAERSLERAVEGWRRAYPGDHACHAIGMAALAWARARSGDLEPEEAQRELERATAALAEAPGLDHSWLAQLHALRADLTGAPP